MRDPQFEEDLEAFIRIVRRLMAKFFGRTMIDVVGSVSVTVEKM